MGIPRKSNNYGWRGNALGLQRWEVECAHKARLDATEAVAHLMRQGKTFNDAKAEIVKRAASVYKFSRPELYEGTMRCVRDVQFGDMPKDIFRRIEDDFLAGIEARRGYKAKGLELLMYRWFGWVWSVDPKKK